VVVDIQFLAADCSWHQLRDATLVAEESGFGAVWVLDHLSGNVFGGESMFECFTLLGALAAVTTRLRVGSLVANVTNRHAGLLAVAAATAQEISGGRFILGLGAGASPESRFAAEQHTLGITIPASVADRHARVTNTLELLDAMWAEQRDDRWAGFPRPVPRPPVIVGVNSRALARLAGARTEGINVRANHPDLEGIIAAGQEAHTRRPGPWSTSVWTPWDDALLDGAHESRRSYATLGVDRLVLVWFTAPDLTAIERAALAFARE
jgi:alkanesulfonate monooxygenase SsuD/methylene tetrahydromethanopterin reductase-like flavin-dependent oxidoreductase (luciferase family)